MLDHRPAGPRRQSAASLVLLGVLGLLGAVGLALLLGGAALALADLATRGEEWDGLGLFLGLLAAVPGSGLLLVGGLLARRVVVARRLAATGDREPLRRTGAVTAAVGAGLLLVLAGSIAWLGVVPAVPAVAVALLLVALGGVVASRP